MSTRSDDKPLGMADLLHCMTCFVRPAGRNKFYISSCGHVFCKNCINDDILLPLSTCKKCRNPDSRLLEINSSLPPEVRELFLPLEETFETFLKDFNKTLSFQENHRNRLMKHLKRKNDQYEKLQTMCKQEMKKKEAYKLEMLKLQEFKKKAVDEIRRLHNTSKTKKKNDFDTTILASNIQSPAPQKQTGFVTSTPFLNKDSPADIKRSHSSNTAVPVFIKPSDPDDDINDIVSGTSKCRLSSPMENFTGKYTTNSCKKRAIGVAKPELIKTVRLSSASFKTPITKKSKLDVGAHAQPIPPPKRC